MSEDLDLLTQHAAYMAKWKGNRQMLTTPCCLHDLEVQAPDEMGIAWDSMMRCPHCGELFMAVAFRDTARGFIPADVGQAIINSAKVEVDMLQAVGRRMNPTGFIDAGQRAAPEPRKGKRDPEGAAAFLSRDARTGLVASI